MADRRAGWSFFFDMSFLLCLARARHHPFWLGQERSRCNADISYFSREPVDDFSVTLIRAS